MDSHVHKKSTKKQPIDLDEYITTAELAKQLKTAPSSLRRSRQSGHLYGFPAPEFIKFGTRKVLYIKASVDLFLQQVAPQRKLYGQ